MDCTRVTGYMNTVNRLPLHAVFWLKTLCLVSRPFILPDSLTLDEFLLLRFSLFLLFFLCYFSLSLLSPLLLQLKIALYRFPSSCFLPSSATIDSPTLCFLYLFLPFKVSIYLSFILSLSRFRFTIVLYLMYCFPVSVISCYFIVTIICNNHLEFLIFSCYQLNKFS